MRVRGQDPLVHNRDASPAVLALHTDDDVGIALTVCHRFVNETADDSHERQPLAAIRQFRDSGQDGNT
jgi:hypothetical protein